MQAFTVINIFLIRDPVTIIFRVKSVQLIECQPIIRACLNRLTRVSNVEPVAYEDDGSFSLLDSCQPVSKMGTSSRGEAKSIVLSSV